MSRRFYVALLVVLMIVLASCGGEEEPLPTLASTSTSPSFQTNTPEPTLTATELPPTTAPTDAPTEIAEAAPPVDDAACEALVASAYEQTRTACEGIGDDEACYGNINIEPQPDTLDFNKAGDIAPVAAIQSLRLSSMNTEKQEWGISLMRLIAAESGESVELLLFGNVELTTGEVSETGLQGFTFTSGADDRPCAAAPDSGILVQTPSGVGEITLLVNEVVIDLGSTAYLQAQPGAEMAVNTLEGQATVTSGGTSVLAPAGTRTTIPVDARGAASGAPSDPEPYTEGPLLPLPVTLLPQTIAVAEPAVVVPTSRTLGAVQQDISFDGAVSPTRSDNYFLTADAGQTLYFYSLVSDSGCCFNWRLFAPDGERVFSVGVGTTADYHDVVMPASGRYRLTLESVGDFAGTYEGQVGVVPPPQTFSINLDDTVAPDGVLEGAGRIEAVGAQDIYTFEVEPGQRIYVEPLTDNQTDQIAWSLLDADETQIFRTTGFGPAFDQEETLERGGAYTLLLDGQKLFMGDYSFKLWDVPPAQVIPIRLDDPSTQGSIATPGADVIYAFTAEPGQQIFLEVTEGDCCDFYWTLSDAQGQQIFRTASANGEEATLEAGGEYSLLVDGISENTGSFTFRVLSVLRSETSVIALDDPPTRGGIDAPGEQDIYSFEAQAGQQIFIEATEGDCCDYYWSVTDASGAELFRTAAVNGTEFTAELGGTYTLMIDGLEENTGPYTFRVLSVAPAQTSDLTLDGPLVQGAIDAPGEQDIYTFTAEPGQQIFIDAPEGDCCDFYWIITDEEGGEPMYTAGVDDSQVTLELGGTYTLTIDGIDENTGPYAFQIFKVVPPQTSEFALGSTVDGEIETYGTEDIYTFSVARAQTVFITKLEEDVPSGLLYFSLLDAEGEYVFQDSYFSPGVIEPFTLVRGGEYELHVYGYGDTLGTYSLRIALDPLGVPPLDGDFIRQWASSATASSQYSDPNWSAMQATGEPDTLRCGDIPTAWASQSARGMDTLELRYEMAVVPERIDIYQTNAPGSIIGVQLIDENDERISLPNAVDPPDNTLCPGVFSVTVDDFSRPVVGVVIQLDQTIGGSWNEIDAVELIGSQP